YSRGCRLKSLRRSTVRGDPGTPNSAKHDWVEDATKRFYRNEVWSREPGNAAHVDPPVEAISSRDARQRGADEAVHGSIARLTQGFARKLIQHKKRAVSSAGDDFGLAPVALREAQQECLLWSYRSPVPAEYATEKTSRAV